MDHFSLEAILLFLSFHFVFVTLTTNLIHSLNKVFVYISIPIYISNVMKQYHRPPCKILDCILTLVLTSFEVSVLRFDFHWWSFVDPILTSYMTVLVFLALDVYVHHLYFLFIFVSRNKNQTKQLCSGSNSLLSSNSFLVRYCWHKGLQ